MHLYRLPCIDSADSISANTTLFALIGTKYGGNGITNFALPNLKAAAPNNTQYLICANGISP